ncbi:MAG: hypothetical protein AB8F95_17075 [Bacteroidia bacterium]
MSFHFEIEKNQKVSYSALLQSLNRDDIKIGNVDSLDLEEDISGYKHFHIPNKSTRGIGVALEDEVFDISINVLASKDDYILACQLAESIAAITDSKIEPEDEEDALTITDFKTKFNESWAEAYKTQGLSATKFLIQKDNSVITIGGCLRPYFIGPDLLEIFSQNASSDSEIYDKIIDSIRAVQFIDESEIRVPNRFEITEEDESKWRYVVIAPGEKQLLPQIEYVILMVNKTEYVKVPFDLLEKYAKSNFTRLDESQYIFPKMAADEFRQIMERFGYQRDTNKGSRKKWWEFWN